AACVMLAATGANAAGAKIRAPAEPSKADRTIEVQMNDTMRFVPAKIEVKKGETVRFVVANEGKVAHEFILGTAADLKAHAAMMKAHAGHAGMQGQGHMHDHMAGHLVVDPGKTGEIAWKFTESGTVEFACLIPGHFEAGMRGTIVVKR